MPCNCMLDRARQRAVRALFMALLFAATFHSSPQLLLFVFASFFGLEVGSPQSILHRKLISGPVFEFMKPINRADL